MTKKEMPTLADVCLREFSSSLYRRNRISGWLTSNIAQARKFVLDDAMSAFMADLAYSSLPKVRNAKRDNDILEGMRKLARLPHKRTWIEFNLHERTNRAQEGYGAPIGKMHQPSRCGWLCLQHEQIDTAFTAIEFAEQTMPGNIPVMQWGIADPALLDIPAASPLCYFWRSDDEPLPFKTLDHELNIHGKPATVPDFVPGYLTGIQSYKTPYLSAGYAPWLPKDHILRKKIIEHNPTANLLEELASDVRYLWSLLASINDTPIGYEHVRPSKGTMIGRNYKKFSEHTIIHLKIPHKVSLTTLAKRVTRASRRRAHQVRGHWRQDWRHEGKKIWIAEHQRGDASLGFVLHDYSVERGEHSSERVQSD